MASTIFALSTPLGRSGLCIFRLSGPKALEASKLLCGIDLSKNQRKMQMIEITKDSKRTDFGMGCFFKGPNSATGEDVVEFNLHGSLAVIQQMRSELLNLKHIGVREAENGEFTKRSLLNNKMSLTEVEALGDLLEAETSLQLEICQYNLKGALETRILKWTTALNDLISEMEALIEFSDTDEISTNNDFNIKQLVSEFRTAIDDSKIYERLRTGFEIMILGPPNAGKSSLLNYLAKDYVSIVSDQAGTTRDLIRHDLNLNGIPIKIIDSAGIRASDCAIEMMGVELAKKAAEKADLLLVLLDESHSSFLKENSDILKSEKTIFVQSLADLRRQDIIIDRQVLKVSSVTGEGVPSLVSAIEQKLLPFRNDSNISERKFFNLRQKESIQEALDYLVKAESSPDLVVKSDLLKQAVVCLRKNFRQFLHWQVNKATRFLFRTLAMVDNRAKEAILDLSKYFNRPVRVELSGGRKVSGVLKGFDQINNIVLDNAREEKDNSEYRELGTLIVRGPSLSFICPAEGFQEVDNPFA